MSIDILHRDDLPLGGFAGLKEHQLNNYLSHLRAIKILEGKTIRNVFIVYPNEGRELSFKFRLNGHPE